MDEEANLFDELLVGCAGIVAETRVSWRLARVEKPFGLFCTNNRLATLSDGVVSEFLPNDDS